MLFPKYALAFYFRQEIIIVLPFSFYFVYFLLESLDSRKKTMTKEAAVIFVFFYFLCLGDKIKSTKFDTVKEKTQKTITIKYEAVNYITTMALRSLDE